VTEALQNPASPKQYDWALAFASSNIRKLSRGEGRQAHLTLSAAIMELAGVKPGDRVLVLPLAEGGFLVRRATGDEVIAAHRLYAKRTPKRVGRLR
jgi:hypothetical protein